MEGFIQPILDQLPAWALVSLYSAVAIGYAIVRIRKPNAPIRHIVKSIHDGIITPERIQSAVKGLFVRGRLPQSFCDWVADTVTSLLIRMPEFFNLSDDTQRSVVASVFSRLTKKQAIQILPVMPQDIARVQFGRKAIAKRIFEHAPMIIRNSIPKTAVRDKDDV